METSNQTIKCSLVNLEVSDLSEENLIELPMVYSTPSLPVSSDTIGMQEDVNRWPHLKGIKMEGIELEVGLLTGSDAPQVLQPKDFRESKDGSPFATRTIFGWVLNGPLGRKESKAPTANFIDTSAKLSKQFEDFCNLEFNDVLCDVSPAVMLGDAGNSLGAEDVVLGACGVDVTTLDVASSDSQVNRSASDVVLGVSVVEGSVSDVVLGASVVDGSASNVVLGACDVDENSSDVVLGASVVDESDSGVGLGASGVDGSASDVGFGTRGFMRVLQMLCWVLVKSHIWIQDRNLISARCG